MQNLIKNISLSCLLLLTMNVNAQLFGRLTSGGKTAQSYEYSKQNCSARGILVHENVVYLATSTGQLIAYDLKTDSIINLMSGKNFQEMRDVAFSDGNIYGMQSGTDGLLAHTNGREFVNFINAKGREWIGVFLDGMDFYGSTGFIMGDPVDGFFKLFYSTDSGKTWLPCEGKVSALKDEGGFAASGTNVQVLNDSTFIFVTGGFASRFFKSTDYGKTWECSSIPYLAGHASGAFSVHFITDQIGVVVGGDYKNPDFIMNNSYFTTDGGKFWTNSKKQVLGYRSCVIEANGIFYACGTTGIDYSKDNGNTWNSFAKGNFLAMASDKTSLYATCTNGTFQKFELLRK